MSGLRLTTTVLRLRDVAAGGRGKSRQNPVDESDGGLNIKTSTAIHVRTSKNRFPGCRLHIF